MRTIWKFELVTITDQVIAMPEGAKLLTAQAQNGVPCIWAMVDSAAEMEPRRILTFGTGHPIREGYLDYLGSYQLDDGKLVFHVFEAP